MPVTRKVKKKPRAKQTIKKVVVRSVKRTKASPLKKRKTSSVALRVQKKKVASKRRNTAKLRVRKVAMVTSVLTLLSTIFFLRKGYKALAFASFLGFAASMTFLAPTSFSYIPAFLSVVFSLLASFFEMSAFFSQPKTLKYGNSTLGGGSV